MLCYFLVKRLTLYPVGGFMEKMWWIFLFLHQIVWRVQYLNSTSKNTCHKIHTITSSIYCAELLAFEGSKDDIFILNDGFGIISKERNRTIEKLTKSCEKSIYFSIVFWRHIKDLFRQITSQLLIFRQRF